MTDPLQIIDDRRVARSLGNQSNAPESQSGLDASGFLLLAEGHLRKALEALGEERSESANNMCAHGNLGQAIYSTRATLKNIRHEKEEPCKP